MKISIDKTLLKKILKLFWPVFLELLLINLLGSMDTLMLSHYNKLCVNAVGTAQSTLALLTVLIIISSNGVSIIVGQYLGAKKYRSASKILSQGIIFNFLIGLILFFIFFFLAGPLLKLVNTNDSYFEYAKTYIQVYSIALPFQAITQVIGANFRAYGKPKYLTYISILANLVNVLLDYLLIYGVGIFPELGILGAAIATTVSLIFKMILAVILNIKLIKCPLFSRKIDFKILKKIIYIGGPSALETLVYTLFSFILVANLNRLSNVEIGSRVYINMMMNYIFLFSNSLSISNSILVSRFVGAKQEDQAKTLTLKITGLGVFIILILVGLLNLIAQPLFYAITQDQTYVDTIKQVLPLLFLLEVGRAINIIIIGAQKSAGDVIFPLFIALGSMSLLMALGSYLFTQVAHLGLFGILLAQALDELLRGIISFIRWLSNKWKNHSIIKESSSSEEEINEAEITNGDI